MPQSRGILLLGAGGHCLSVLDSLIALSEYDKIGIVDMATSNSTEEGANMIMGIPVVGTDEDLNQLHKEGYTNAFISVGSVGDVSLRARLYHMLKRIGFEIPNIIDKSSIVSPFATLGEGIYIGKKSVVNVNTKVGNNCILNTACIIEHECRLGDFVHISPGSVLNGNVRIDAGTHIGAGSIIKQGIHVGSDTMIGMGSIVLIDIGNNKTAYGNPCKEVAHE